jgi:hypothetical protein
VETVVPQAKQPVPETPETVFVETDRRALQRDLTTYYRRIKSSKSEEAKQHNRTIFLQRKAALEKLGLQVVEQNGTILTIDPRKN